MNCFNCCLEDNELKNELKDDEKGCETFVLLILFLFCFIKHYDGYKNY
jgi:hypothetical protein